MCTTANVLSDFDAGDARHVNIEKANGRVERIKLIDRFAAVASLRDYGKLRPCLCEHAFERISE
jgi:hypothetical protein